jgi:hypothetical protein
MTAMSTKKREVIWGGRVSAAKRHVEHALFDSMFRLVVSSQEGPWTGGTL